MASIAPGAPKTGARHMTNAPHLASIRPPGTAECLSPVCINQWLALLQRLPNWCQAHHEPITFLLASVPPSHRRVPAPRLHQPMASIAPGAPKPVPGT
jgi:hypothetical protein